MYSLMIWAAIAFNTITHEVKYSWIEVGTFEPILVDGTKLNAELHCKYAAMQLNLQKYKCFLKT